MTLARESMPGFIRKRGVSDENADVDKTASSYRDKFDGKDASITERQTGALDMVNQYYDLVTDFYEFGWGQAFHFAPRYIGESFEESLERHEYYLALRAGWKNNMKIVDLGCGVGGPLRNIVRFTQANVTGVNNNAYQISRSQRHDAKYGLEHMTNYVRADFNNMPVGDAAMDGAYAIEATCHAADRTKCFKEIHRVLKSGSYFTGYEWVLTPKYDHANSEHRHVRHQIELGNGLPSLTSGDVVKKSLEEAGFIVEDFFDMIERFENGKAKAHTWYEPLQGSYSSLSGLRATPVGRFCTRLLCMCCEKLRIAEKGATATQDILEEAAQGLVRGGELQIFTPALFFLARKP